MVERDEEGFPISPKREQSDGNARELHRLTQLQRISRNSTSVSHGKARMCTGEEIFVLVFSIRTLQAQDSRLSGGLRHRTYYHLTRIRVDSKHLDSTLNFASISFSLVLN